MYCHRSDRIRLSLGQRQRSLTTKESNHVIECPVCTAAVEEMCQGADTGTQRSIISAFRGSVDLCECGKIHAFTAFCECGG